MPNRAHENHKRKNATRDYSAEEIALLNLAFCADNVWMVSSDDALKQACQKSWVLFNRIKEAFKKTSILDALAEVQGKQKKTVRDTIPFSHLAQYDNYEYDSASERSWLTTESTLLCQGEQKSLNEQEFMNSVQNISYDFDLLSLESDVISNHDSKKHADLRMLDVCMFEQLEYTAGFHEDPTLGGPCSPPIGSFSRICGSFDPIKFGSLVKKILEVDEKSLNRPHLRTEKINLRRNSCISWTNWLLHIYPEFLQNLCSREDVSKGSLTKIESAVDYIDLLDKPITVKDMNQYPRPRLRVWGHNVLHKNRLFEQITSEGVRQLWVDDKNIPDSMAKANFWMADATVVLPLENFRLKIDENIRPPSPFPTCTWRMDKAGRRIRKKSSPQNLRRKDESRYLPEKTPQSVIVNETEKLKKEENGASKIASAPTLSDLTSDDFPTLSEAATMNFRRPTRDRHTMNHSIFNSTSDWSNFMFVPVQRNVHSKSDTDLHRSISYASVQQDSPLSESSSGLRSESDSDIQLLESFRRREEDAKCLLQSNTSTHSSSSDSSEISPKGLPLELDDTHMNINAPSFMPRLQQSPRQLFQSSANFMPVYVHESNQSSGMHLYRSQGKHRLDARQKNSAFRYSGTRRQHEWHQSVSQSQPHQVVQQHTSHQPLVNSQRIALQLHSNRRIPFNQNQQHWRQPFSKIPQIICKPPPGFEPLFTESSAMQITASLPTTASINLPVVQGPPPPPPPPPPVPPPQGLTNIAVYTQQQQQQHFYHPSPTLQSLPNTSIGNYIPSNTSPFISSAQISHQPEMSSFSSLSINEAIIPPQALTSSSSDSGPHLNGNIASSNSGTVSGLGGFFTGSHAEGQGTAKTSLDNGLLPIPDVASYLENMQQLIYPFGGPNQLLPNCRYVLPPPVRMPGPQQFLTTISSIPNPNPPCSNPRGASDMNVVFTHLPHHSMQNVSNHGEFHAPQAPAYGNIFPSQLFPPNPNITSNSNSVQFPLSENVLPVLQQHAQSNLNKTYLASRSSFNATANANHVSMKWSGWEDTKEMVHSPRYNPQPWRYYQPNQNPNYRCNSIPCDNGSPVPCIPFSAFPPTSNSSNNSETFRIDAISAATSDGRKTRHRKRDPSNLVQLVGTEGPNYGHRRERRRSTRYRQNQGSMLLYESSSACSRDTLSEDSEPSITQNDESPVEWVMTPPSLDKDESSKCSELSSFLISQSPISKIDNVMQLLNPPRRSSNTPGSSYSSDTEMPYEESIKNRNETPRGIGTIKRATDSTSRTSKQKYQPFKECLGIPEPLDIQSKDMRPFIMADEFSPRISDSGKYTPRMLRPSSAEMFFMSPSSKHTDISDLLSPTHPLSSGEQPSSSHSTSSQSIQSLGTLHECEGDLSESALLHQLARWSAAKLADEAEYVEQTEITDGFGFRWIHDDDLERQAAAEYCPSKESSLEKLVDRPLHFLDRRAAADNRECSGTAMQKPSSTERQRTDARPDGRGMTNGDEPTSSTGGDDRPANSIFLHVHTFDDHQNSPNQRAGSDCVKKNFRKYDSKKDNQQCSCSDKKKDPSSTDSGTKKSLSCEKIASSLNKHKKCKTPTRITYINEIKPNCDYNEVEKKNSKDCFGKNNRQTKILHFSKQNNCSTERSHVYNLLAYSKELTLNDMSKNVHSANIKPSNKTIDREKMENFNVQEKLVESRSENSKQVDSDNILFAAGRNVQNKNIIINPRCTSNISMIKISSQKSSLSSNPPFTKNRNANLPSNSVCKTENMEQLKGTEKEKMFNTKNASGNKGSSNENIPTAVGTIKSKSNGRKESMSTMLEKLSILAETLLPPVIPFNTPEIKSTNKANSKELDSSAAPKQKILARFQKDCPYWNCVRQIHNNRIIRRLESYRQNCLPRTTSPSDVAKSVATVQSSLMHVL